MRVAFSLSDPRQFLALGLGAGLVPRAPGTVGTIVAAPFVWGLAHLPALGYFAVLVAAFALGCWICGATARAVGVHDHPAIVWDEFVGLAVAMWALPPSLPVVAGAVALFRVFDVFKPWPIRWLDRHLTGGFGIMLDDAIAGIPVALLLHGAVAIEWIG